MSEDQLVTLFGDVTIVQVIMWLIAAGLLITVFTKVWPSFTKLAQSINLLLQLNEKLAAMDSTLERVRAQVENSHSTNLRKEMDVDRVERNSQHTQSVSIMRGIQKDVGRLDERDIERGREIRAMDTKLDEHLEWSHEWKARQEEAGRDAAGRIRDIEDTINPTKDTSQER